VPGLRGCVQPVGQTRCKKLGNVKPAENAYVLALTAAPMYDAPRFNLGLLQLRQNDVTALETFTELLRRRPDYPNAYLARAQAYAMKGDNDAALADLDEAVRRQPTSAEAWASLGELRERRTRAMPMRLTAARRGSVTQRPPNAAPPRRTDHSVRSPSRVDRTSMFGGVLP